MKLLVCPNVRGDECRLRGIGDVHLGSPDCDEDLLKSDILKVKNDPQARVIITGDLLNYVTKGSKGNVYYELYPPSHQKKLARKLLLPIRDKILCIIGGNHDELRTQEDAQPIEDIADYLEVPYSQGEACLKLPVGEKRNGKPATYTIYITHGSSSSRMIGSKSQTLDRLKDIVLCELYMMGHTHTQHVHKDSYFVPDLYNNNVREVVRHFVNCGSYQKRGDYPKRRSLPGTVLGTPVIRLSGRRKEIIVEV